ncbi:MAG: hypothetical protein QOH25_1994 [Acidobacteriota bacterium]|jgi:chromosome segregation ATPase|nr:hypothetical protein [Acidobacteriota bacterium]
MSEDYTKIKRRVKTVEEAIQLLTHMARRADERMDEADERIDGFEAALTNLTVKLEALADAQIRTEELVARAQVRTEESMARLAEAQAHTDQRLDALINIVREGRNGQ